MSLKSHVAELCPAPPPFDEASSPFRLGGTHPVWSSSNSPSHSGQSKLTLHVQPAYSQKTEGGGRQFSLTNFDPSRLEQCHEWVKNDLSVERLNGIHQHLWLAGLPQASRSLHDHVRIGREIKLSDQADLHLTWQDNKISLKPVPDYLLCSEFWQGAICSNASLFEDASGLLLSYLWLISSRTDWKLATTIGLLNEDVTWEAWVNMSTEIWLNKPYENMRNVNPRYLYGELRLTRLNWIYRLCSSTRSKRFIRGYDYGYYQYSSFFSRNFTWLLTAIVYVGLVLAAMSVGLATERLQANSSFQRAAVGFSAFSIIFPLVVLAMAVFLLFFLLAKNWSHTNKRQTEIKEKYPYLINNPRTQAHERPAKTTNGRWRGFTKSKGQLDESV